MRKLLSKNKISIVIVMIAAILVGALFPTFAPKRAFAEESEHTYVESTDEIVNPAAGFYKAIGVKLRRGVSDAPVAEYTISNNARDYGLLHLLFDLADFSANAGGADAEIDANALAAAEKVFGYLRKYKVGAIIRFDYNRNGTTSNGKYIDAEPDLELVLKHIENVSGVITRYSDVILGVESGMLGPWGEQHSTTLASSGAETYYKLVQKWLDNTPATMGITVRRPLYFIYWANKKFNLNLSVSDLADFDVSEYPQAQRVGVYNDGYLGSSSDLGTFTDRAAETAFIGKQAEHTYYGGELVADSQTGLLGDYNSVSYLETEAFVTHTSYLNIDWNYNVFNAYRAQTYTGSNQLYNNGTTTEFTYLKNRLGYRFYLSENYAATVSNTNEATLKFAISNAGFARILCPCTSQLVFTDGTNTVTVDCDVNLSEIPSAENATTAGTKQFQLSVAIPNALPYGDYDVYLRFFTQYGAEIRLANDQFICAPNREGVKIATVTKSEPSQTNPPENDPTQTKPPQKNPDDNSKPSNMRYVIIICSVAAATMCLVAVFVVLYRKKKR